MKNSFLLIASIITLFSGTQCFAQENHRAIEKFMDEVVDYHKEHKTSLIYRVQLCNGDEEKAYSTKSLFEEQFPQYGVFVIYEQPDWKTQFGSFLNRLEADVALLKVQKSFPEAIVTKERIK